MLNAYPYGSVTEPLFSCPFLLGYHLIFSNLSELDENDLPMTFNSTCPQIWKPFLICPATMIFPLKAFCLHLSLWHFALSLQRIVTFVYIWVSLFCLHGWESPPGHLELFGLQFAYCICIMAKCAHNSHGKHEVALEMSWQDENLSWETKGTHRDCG